MFEEVKNKIFTRPIFDTKLSEIDFMMTLSSILESFWLASVFTYRFLVAPVANAVICFGNKFPSLTFRVESDLESREMAVDVGRCWLRLEVGGRGGGQRREGEASPPSFESISSTI